MKEELKKLKDSFKILQTEKMQEIKEMEASAWRDALQEHSLDLLSIKKLSLQDKITMWRDYSILYMYLKRVSADIQEYKDEEVLEKITSPSIKEKRDLLIDISEEIFPGNKYSRAKKACAKIIQLIEQSYPFIKKIIYKKDYNLINYNDFNSLVIEFTVSRKAFHFSLNKKKEASVVLEILLKDSDLLFLEIAQGENVLGSVLEIIKNDQVKTTAVINQNYGFGRKEYKAIEVMFSKSIPIPSLLDVYPELIERVHLEYENLQNDPD